jgi:hypothetical protein
LSLIASCEIKPIVVSVCVKKIKFPKCPSLEPGNSLGKIILKGFGFE